MPVPGRKTQEKLHRLIREGGLFEIKSVYYASCGMPDGGRSQRLGPFLEEEQAYLAAEAYVGAVGQVNSVDAVEAIVFWEQGGSPRGCCRLDEFRWIAEVGDEIEAVRRALRGVDSETLRYLANHPNLIKRTAERRAQEEALPKESS